MVQLFLDREREEGMYILLICTVICTIILFWICNTKFLGNGEIHDDVVSPVMKKIGDNEKVAKEILSYIGNSTTKVEKNEDEKIKASFYNGNTDKITIKNTSDLEECSRIVHIAHECIHSIQDKKLIKFHFIFSNIQILYFLGIFIYFFYNKDTSIRMPLLIIQLLIFVATFFMKIVLESDATYRGPQLAFSYLSDKVGKDEIKGFKDNVEEKLYKMVPASYFGLYMQGAMLLIIAQVGAIFI